MTEMIPVARIRKVLEIAGDHDEVPLGALRYLALEIEPSDEDMAWARQVADRITEEAGWPGSESS